MNMFEEGANAYRKNNEGSALILTAGALLLLIVLVGVAFDLTNNVGRDSQRATIRQNAYAIADGALELEFAEWKAVCQNGITFAPGSATFDNITLPTASMFPTVSNFSATRTGSSGYVLSNYQVQAVDSLLTPLTDPNQSPPGVTVGGTTSYNYLATATVTLPARGKQSVTVNLARVFQLSTQSPWTDAIFFDQDLEINPGGGMKINGTVHTNKDLYVGGASGVVTFSGDVEASGTISIGKSPLDPSSRNNKTPPVYPPGYPIPSVAQQSPMGVTHSALSTTDSNPNNDSYHEMIEQRDPTKDASGNYVYSDPFSSSNGAGSNVSNLRFYDQADFKIIIGSASDSLSDSKPIVTILDSNGQPVSKTISSAFTSGFTVGSGKKAATYQILTLNDSIQDSREGATMVTTDVNIGALKAAVDNGIINTSANGLVIYVADVRPTMAAKAGVNSKMEPAIRLEDGGFLPDNGLTLATLNPVYIQGDYNTGALDPTKLASNTSNGGANTAGNYWEPSAVIADAVNILSNSWTTSSTGSTKASSTTINTAIMAGNVPSNGKSYSGGAENFLRLHEDWTHKTLTYFGSMVCAYSSQQATGPWTGSDYKLPYRDWNFDTNFNTHTPPGTFLAPGYLRQRWYINQ